MSLVASLAGMRCSGHLFQLEQPDESWRFPSRCGDANGQARSELRGDSRGERKASGKAAAAPGLFTEMGHKVKAVKANPFFLATHCAIVKIRRRGSSQTSTRCGGRSGCPDRSLPWPTCLQRGALSGSQALATAVVAFPPVRQGSCKNCVTDSFLYHTGFRGRAVIATHNSRVGQCQNAQILAGSECGCELPGTRTCYEILAGINCKNLP